MHSKLFLVPVALAALSTATPLYNSPNATHSTISVPLHKRASAAGSGIANAFDIEALIAHKAMTERKYKRNVIAQSGSSYVRRDGSQPHPSRPDSGTTNADPKDPKDPRADPNAEQKGPSTPTAPVDSSAPPAQGIAAVKLADENNMMWTMEVEIGTPPQKFTVNVDTGSPTLWVPAAACQAGGCAEKKNKYDTSKSSTANSNEHAANDSAKLQFGDGTTVEGKMTQDIVKMGGIDVNMTFISASTISDQLGNYPVDGTFGLGIPSAGEQNETMSFIMTAQRNGKLKEMVFGMKLAGNDSELSLGGPNNALFSAPPENHPVVADTNWMLADGEMGANGQKLAGKLSTIIDSGTTLVLGPQTAVEQIYTAVNDAQNYTSADGKPTGLYVFPCQNAPLVYFKWGQSKWTMSKDTFTWRKLATDDSKCIGGVAAFTEDILGNKWILGDSFLRNVYTTFSLVDNKAQVGFSPLK